MNLRESALRSPQIVPLVTTAAFGVVEVRAVAVKAAMEVVRTVMEAMRTVPEAVGTARVALRMATLVALWMATPAAVDREMTEGVDRRNRGKAAPRTARHPPWRRIERRKGRSKTWWSSRGKDTSRLGPGTCCPATGSRSYRSSDSYKPW